jgi:site-specific DNA recombinase
MQKQRRNGRTSTNTSVEDEIAHLRGLDLKGLRSRWQSVFQRLAPPYLTRHLLFSVIAYRLQADRFGDLDHAAIRARKIDVIVVYKVDRLTRSLADFAKLVELFDAHGVSFVSVTQQFNTTTSMGRLTLNVLLSFAQFEREVTSERIRDKIAASKRKGIWVGGNLPLGYEMKDGKVAVVEEEAEQVRLIFRRYLELGSVNELVRDLGERNIKTKFKKLSTGATRGGIPFGRGALYYLLNNRFYIGEVEYKDEILPGEQPVILDRALFEAVRQKALAQWSHRTLARKKSGCPLTGLLFDDAGHRMVPTHATKAGVRYRYYASAPVLHGEAKTASVGTISRVPATDVEEAIAKSLKHHLAEQQNGSTASAARIDDRAALEQLVAAITVHKDKLIVRLKTEAEDERSDNSDDRSLTIHWQKPPSKRRRQILLPSNKSRSEVRPQHFERRARLVSAIARGRQWLDDVVSGRVTTIAELCAREKCSVRQVNLTISLAFLAPNLVKAAIEGRLPRGIGIERLRDLPAEWSRQFEALGLNPE